MCALAYSNSYLSIFFLGLHTRLTEALWTYFLAKAAIEERYKVLC